MLVFFVRVGFGNRIMIIICTYTKVIHLDKQLIACVDKHKHMHTHARTHVHTHIHPHSIILIYGYEYMSFAIPIFYYNYVRACFHLDQILCSRGMRN